jgi:Cupin-like domain
MSIGRSPVLSVRSVALAALVASICVSSVAWAAAAGGAGGAGGERRLVTVADVEEAWKGAETAYKAEKWAEAASLASEVLAASPRHAPAYALRGRSLLALGDASRALEAVGFALQLDAMSETLRVDLSVIAARLVLSLSEARARALDQAAAAWSGGAPEGGISLRGEGGATGGAGGAQAEVGARGSVTDAWSARLEGSMGRVMTSTVPAHAPPAPTLLSPTELERRFQELVAKGPSGPVASEDAALAAWKQRMWPKHEHRIRPLPRVHVSELWRKEGRAWERVLRPHVLVGLMEEWPGWTHWKNDLRVRPPQSVQAALGSRGDPWTVTWWVDEFGGDVAEHYRLNLKRPENKPHLVTLEEALKFITQQTSNRWSREARADGTGKPRAAAVEFNHERAPASNESSYVHLTLDTEQWNKMRRFIAALPPAMHADEAWLEGCLGGDRNGTDFATEYLLANHWRIVLMGNHGAGMFNHVDTLQTSSYQAHVRGRKRWHICEAATNNHILRPLERQSPDLMRPDYAKFPSLRNLDCFADELVAGEVLVYPKNYWHQTEIVDDFSVFLTGTAVMDDNFPNVSDMLRKDCAENRTRVDFLKNSVEICKVLDKHCYPWWKQAFKSSEYKKQGAAQPAHPAQPAQELASAKYGRPEPTCDTAARNRLIADLIHARNRTMTPRSALM